MPVILFFFLLSSLTFACKLMQGEGLKGEETAAIFAVKKKTSAKHVKIMPGKGNWLVRTTKPSCIEYQVATKRHPDCKVTAEILTERPCP